MGKAWDYDVPQVEVWREVLRVLKPGGHLLAFAGTRTQHRMAVAIEDAGFEIRDLIAWVYGSGFPKSRNLDGDWQGWGTALKPALEPITVARKPLTGTVAANVLEHGTGAINVDGCRVGTSKDVPSSVSTSSQWFGVNGESGAESGHNPNIGRWPANLIHDGSDEVVGLFPQADGMKRGTLRRGATTGLAMGAHGIYGEMQPMELQAGYGDTGSAARFFYCAKASKADRGDGNGHPTVKPTELMRYLCRLVTPPGGVVLDPFMGSGSTGKAAALEGFQFIGIEREAEYLEIACQRVQAFSLQGAFL
jgi:site-specific DNA-methyltransferase (adenine-specific)